MCLNGDEWDTKEMIRYVYMNGKHLFKDNKYAQLLIKNRKLTFLFLADIRVAEEVPLSGDIFIYDLEHLKAMHVLKYATPLLKKALVVAHNAYPQRLKRIHIVNTPPFAEKFIIFTKQFLNEKMKDRVRQIENVNESFINNCFLSLVRCAQFYGRSSRVLSK